MPVLTAPRFWEAPVEPTTTVDLAALPIYRKRLFPEAGPTPWLDRPDAKALIAQRLAAHEITAAEAELCRKWSRDGYLILEGFYGDDVLDPSWAAYEAAIAAGAVDAPPDPFYDGDTVPGRTANVHFGVPALDDLLHEPRMGRLVSLLLGARAQPFQTIIGHKSSRQLEHSDSIHMSTWPLGYLAANWIAYEDVDPDSGPLVYYPGSQRLPYLLSEELQIPPEQNYGGYAERYEPAIQALIARHGLEARRFLPKKGDVLLWHANLLHGGSAVKNPRLSRKALVCHFFAEGCVCYHDLTGTLAHNQLNLDLYRFRREAQAPTLESPGLLARVGAVLRSEGAVGVLKRAAAAIRRG
jgi:hypothetical protein